MAAGITFTCVQIDNPLIPIDEAKRQLKVTDTAHDTEITEFVLLAQNVILAILKAAADPAWDPATTPAPTPLPNPIRAAIRLMLTHMYEHRGDDMNPSSSGSTPDKELWDAIDRLLAPFRDPALA